MMLMRAEAGLKGRMDWILAGSAFLLVVLGTISIWSAASPMPHQAQILQRHFLAMIFGSLAFFFGASFNYQIFQDQSRTLYALMVVILICVLVFGVTMRGQKSWLRLPYFMFQPSEFARICTVLVLANYLDRRGTKMENVGSLFGGLAIAAPILVLILAQPDFSSTLIFFPMIICMLFCAGARLSYLLMMGSFGAITLAMPLLWTLFQLRPQLAQKSSAAAFFMSISSFNLKFAFAVLGIFAIALIVWWIMDMLRVHIPVLLSLVSATVVTAALSSAVVINSHIKWYQRKRFLAFLAPEIDPQGAAYNVNQALVAIGSGGFFGKGVFSGTQSQLGFLPERHTDFIFAVLGEELGFIGSMLVLMLYLTLMWRIVEAAWLARDRYGFLVCTGLLSMLAFYLLINVGMCVGLMPVAGVPLPLVSYGGSSLVITLWALGIAANIHSKRYAFA